jgi:hypothetical protein
MSTYKEIKKDFILDLASSHGNTWKFGKYPELSGNIIPERLLDKWTKRFYKQTPPSLSTQPRLVNHFKLGADPEFVFMVGGRVAHASELGLRAGLAVGADNNGRLAELRPKPSKFALEVVASMYAELCFLAQWNPALTRYTWYAQPYVDRDGLGGHIHFGRWQKLRKQEVTALDNIMCLFYDAGCISRAHQKERLGTQLYGKFGDIREQAHGYEYRTFPTWLGCPRHAHLYLTLAKLAVYNPKMHHLVRRGSVFEAQQYIKNILSYYQNLDDDAKIALCYLENCWVPPIGDIQKAWNIVPNFKGVGDPDTDIMPPFIKPNPAHVSAMFEYLTKGTKYVVADTFEPLRFPKGFTPFQRVLVTDRRPELGEVVWDMALVPGDFTLGTITSHNAPDTSLRVSGLLYELIKKKLISAEYFMSPTGKPFKVSVMPGTKTIDVSFPSGMLDKRHRKWLKKFLTEDGIFPFVKLGQEYVPRNWKVRFKETLLLRA